MPFAAVATPLALDFRSYRLSMLRRTVEAMGTTVREAEDLLRDHAHVKEAEVELGRHLTDEERTALTAEFNQYVVHMRETSELFRARLDEAELANLRES